MCGIVGACTVQLVPGLSDIVSRMNALLRHRGPDSEGKFVSPCVTIAMRRLAVIDLTTGDQPQYDDTGSVVAVLNGEIYNYRQLTAELEKEGFRFRTKSDTEVLVHGYRKWGEGTFSHLKGMFACAIYDTKANRLLLGRDRFGEKPLVYLHTGGTLVFASEINALMAWPEVSRKVSLEALGYYLRLGFAPSPLTLFDGIQELPPGCWLSWQDGRVSVSRYYRPDYSTDPALRDYGAAVEAVREAVDRSVRRQSESDVPIGALLSGGIDSSSVVAMLQRSSPKPVKTFTVKFAEASYDESEVARAVSAHLGTEHQEIPVPNSGFEPDDLWRTVEHVGQPFPDSSAIPVFKVSREVRRHVTVCLTGDGGDEMFAGYPTYAWAASVDRLAALPRPLLRMTHVAARTAAHWPAVPGGTRLRRLGRAVESAAQPQPMRLATLVSLFLPVELPSLISDRQVLEVANGRLERYAALPEEAETWTPLRRTMYTMLTQSLPQDMLAKTDRMSMACSLELRAPMLGTEVAEVAMRLPDSALINRGVQKRVLRDAMRPYLPEVVFSHPKTGFSIPLHAYQNKAFEETAHDLLDSPPPLFGALNERFVKNTLERGIKLKSDRADVSVYRSAHQLWALMQLAAWVRVFDVTA